MEPIKNKSLTMQVKDSILNYIKTINLNETTKLPSEENLAQLLGVSRITIRSALNVLASDGVLFRRHGKGTFINKEALKVKTSLSPTSEITDIIKANGFVPRVKLLSCTKLFPQQKIYESLNISAKSDVIEIKKIFFANETPCVYSIDYIAFDFLHSLNDFEELKKYESSIYKFIYEKYNEIIEWDNVHITTTTNVEDNTLNSVFNCNKSIKSFLVVEGINYNSKDKAILFSTEYIDTKFISFNQIRKKITY
ncbi:GntR family transcriptional regulator [Clostridium sp. D53t1_180928_C8]|uniref:GntR family transcriptional regulator n=1 Tax=Clostridium sp. D53t1_180928_C8 TaxID=2787101 RepID=UPI0018ABEEF8|nr:GntR family transcriptional regulator [Clostridium sp. D53t1_180928_C8]